MKRIFRRVAVIPTRGVTRLKSLDFLNGPFDSTYVDLHSRTIRVYGKVATEILTNLL